VRNLCIKKWFDPQKYCLKGRPEAAKSKAKDPNWILKKYIARLGERNSENPVKPD